MVMAAACAERTWSNHSSLTLVRSGARGTIRSLQLGNLGLTFYYMPPKGEPPILAKAPELIQRVAVAAVGK